jgi:hypothetical protein
VSPFDALDLEQVVQGVERPVADSIRAWWGTAEAESKKIGGKIMSKQMIQFVADFIQWLHMDPSQPEGAILVFCTGVHWCTCTYTCSASVRISFQCHGVRVGLFLFPHTLLSCLVEGCGPRIHSVNRNNSRACE